MARLIFTVALLLLFYVSDGAAQEGKWGPYLFQNGAGLTGAAFKHDDGGSLVVACNKAKHLMMLFLMEPRAAWHQGDPMELVVRADDGQEIRVKGAVIAPTIIAVRNDSTWGLYIMGKARNFFAVGNGEYARVFPTENFRNSVEPVLRACGDHW